MRKRLSDERGISAVIVAISLIAIFGAAMLSLDAGNMWQTRRNIITGTDSTALDQAKHLAFADVTTSCAASWTDYMVRNSGGGLGVTPISCVPHANPDGTGYVVVEGRKEAQTRLGGFFGIGNTNPYSLSAAQWGYVTEGRGLRPMAFCNQNDHVQEWLQKVDGGETTPAEEKAYNDLRGAGDTDGDGRIDHPVPSNPSWGVLHRMYFNLGAGDSGCGTFPGNWGWLSFNGNSASGGTGQPEINDWIQNGYNTDTVSIRDGGDPACPGVPGQGDADDSHVGCVPADPGTLSSANRTYLDSILGKPIHVMVFDTGACGSGGSGGGATCTFEAWGFLGVTLRAYHETGPQASRYFDFEFSELLMSGTCCSAAPPNGVDTGQRGIKLCEVDHDFQVGQTVATRCAPSS